MSTLIKLTELYIKYKSYYVDDDDNIWDTNEKIIIGKLLHNSEIYRELSELDTVIKYIQAYPNFKQVKEMEEFVNSLIEKSIELDSKIPNNDNDICLGICWNQCVNCIGYTPSEDNHFCNLFPCTKCKRKNIPYYVYERDDECHECSLERSFRKREMYTKCELCTCENGLKAKWDRGFFCQHFFCHKCSLIIFDKIETPEIIYEMIDDGDDYGPNISSHLHIVEDQEDYIDRKDDNSINRKDDKSDNENNNDDGMTSLEKSPTLENVIILDMHGDPYNSYPYHQCQNSENQNESYNEGENVSEREHQIHKHAFRKCPIKYCTYKDQLLLENRDKNKIHKGLYNKYDEILEQDEAKYEDQHHWVTKWDMFEKHSKLIYGNNIGPKLFKEKYITLNEDSRTEIDLALKINLPKDILYGHIVPQLMLFHKTCKTCLKDRERLNRDGVCKFCLLDIKII